MSYVMTVTLDADLAETEGLVRDALQEQGFGILSEIDVQATLQSKLDEDIGGYRILGACNPPLAKRAIELDPDIGALLPCNVLLRSDPAGGTIVSAADPAAMMELGGERLTEVASEARARLQIALDHLTERR